MVMQALKVLEVGKSLGGVVFVGAALDYQRMDGWARLNLSCFLWGVLISYGTDKWTFITSHRLRVQLLMISRYIARKSPRYPTTIRDGVQKSDVIGPEGRFYAVFGD